MGYHTGHFFLTEDLEGERVLEELHGSLRGAQPASCLLLQVSFLYIGGGDYSTERNGTERNGMMD